MSSYPGDLRKDGVSGILVWGGVGVEALVHIITYSESNQHPENKEFIITKCRNKQTKLMDKKEKNLLLKLLRCFIDILLKKRKANIFYK